ncbi:MAG TPA: ABC transporter ATP-binding protein [Candidatus Hydrogenedentes bacterium]|nr:ABC transporter ATP-binding protein [Candidatus Hydrogenedentota bacterium]
MSEYAIEIDDAVVSYREGVALRGVSLRVRPGEFVGVIGPNGAGKTTLLTVVNGLGRLLHGRARVLGMSPYNGQARRLRSRIGYVAQAERIDPRLPIRVRETVLAGRYGRLGWFKRPSRADRKEVEAALDRVGVVHLADRPIGHLSGGEYQRVAIARALVQHPDIFLFDEPTASIDPQAQADILDLVQRIHHETRATVLYVTHELATLPEKCRRLLLMREGSIWRQGEREAMLEAATLAELYNSVIAGRRSPDPVLS